MGRVDPITGVTACSFPIKDLLPNTTCVWSLGEGTRGQTSASFNGNQTFFFSIQEKCAGGTRGRTYVMSSMGPFCANNVQDVRVWPFALIDLDFDLEDLNMAWDHTCNTVVVTPNHVNDTLLFEVNQISEYDGAQRFQPSYDGVSGWKKVPGLGALDYGDRRPSWPQGEELNCGQKCVFYTIEEQIIDGVAVLPRAFIGRKYRTAELAINVTDALQVKTLSWNLFNNYYQNPYNQFLGIGVCCSESWCHPECKSMNIKDGNTVLLSYSPPPGDGFQILAEIGAFDADTVRLSVEYSGQFNKDHHLYVFHENTILTYDVVDTNGYINSVKLSSQSPSVSTGSLSYWFYPGY